MKKLFFLIIALAIISFAEQPQMAHSQVLQYGGGYLTYVNYCTCSANTLLYIYDYTTNNVQQILYEPGVSTLRANYNIFTTGPKVLYGTLPTGVQCLNYYGTTCTTFGSPTAMVDTTRGIGSTGSSF